MNRCIPLLLILLLLYGCAAQDPLPAPTGVSPADDPEPPPAFMEPAMQTQSAEWFVLPDDVSGFLPLNENLLFLSGREQTLLTLVDPASQQIIAHHQSGTALTLETAGLQRVCNGFSYFSSDRSETILLGPELQEQTAIAAPEDLLGKPFLSENGSSLYYCTPSALRVLDTATGISSVLRETASPSQEVTGLLLEDSVLQLRIEETDGTRRSLFVSTENGRLLGDHGEDTMPQTQGTAYFLCRQDGVYQTIFVGSAGEEPLVLMPREEAGNCFFLGDRVLTACIQDGHPVLDLYDLHTGLRTAAFSLLPEGSSLRHAAAGNDGTLWLLCRQADGRMLLGRWDPGLSRTNDDSQYLAPRYTPEKPDLEGLDNCKLYAQELSQRHGIQILICEEAAMQQPRGYILEQEHDAAILMRELELLDARLRHYPAGFLPRLSEAFPGLQICILGKIQEHPGSGVTDSRDGIFLQDSAGIFLAAGHAWEQTLYHALCRLIDTVVLTRSTAYDHWDRLNPADFQYANSYDHSLQPDDWLQAGWDTFADRDSMSYATEDRAGIMKYAMTQGQEELFLSPYLQAKLHLLCTGIREAFHLEDSTNTYLWEQYLSKPLAVQP